MTHIDRSWIIRLTHGKLNEQVCDISGWLAVHAIFYGIFDILLFIARKLDIDLVRIHYILWTCLLNITVYLLLPNLVIWRFKLENDLTWLKVGDFVIIHELLSIFDAATGKDFKTSCVRLDSPLKEL